jgi:fibronectin-binding autotransporter adhesin
MICHELQVSDAYTRSDEMLRMIKFLAAVLAVSAMATSSGAAVYQWDAVAGGDAVVQDGTGTWSVAGANWYDRTAPINDQNWTDGNDALFGSGASGTAGKVTVSGTVAPSSLTFEQPFDGNYTLSGGTISLGSGGITDNATGVTTVGSALKRSSDTTITTAAGAHWILDGGGSGEFLIYKDGPGMLTLDGTHTWGSASQTAWRVNGGTMNVAGTATTAGRTGGGVENDSTMNITGTFTSGGHDHGINGTVNLTGNGRWNLEGGGIFELPVNGTLNIQDNAVLDVDRSAGVSGAWQIGSLSLGMGWGSSTAIINQSGNSTVNLTFPTESFWTANGPGLVLGGVVVRDVPYDVSATYDLNGGTLNVSGVFNVNMENNGGGPTLIAPTGPVVAGGNGQIAVFNFNGGTMKASQSDSTAAQVVSEGLDHLMGNLWHAYVKSGGAIIDTDGHNASINQALEHDRALGTDPDGGLQKLGAGTLTLLQENTYTGPTVVTDGTLRLTQATCLSTNTEVYLYTEAALYLDFDGAQTVHALYVNGVQMANGTWGSSASRAAYRNDTFFDVSGSGILTIGTVPPWTTLIIR